MVLGIALLSKPIWSIFYGTSDIELGGLVLAVYIFTPLFFNLYMITSSTLQSCNKFKMVYLTTLLGYATNAILDVPLMIVFHNLGANVSYGAIAAALIGYTLSISTSLIVLYKKYGFRFDATLKRLPKYIVSWLVFVLVIVVLKQFIPTNLDNRLLQIPILVVFGLISFVVYIYMSDRIGNVELVFGINVNDLIKKLLKKIKRSS